jgi:hypothetical protein
MVAGFRLDHAMDALREFHRADVLHRDISQGSFCMT